MTWVLVFMRVFICKCISVHKGVYLCTECCSVWLDDNNLSLLDRDTVYFSNKRPHAYLWSFDINGPFVLSLFPPSLSLLLSLSHHHLSHVPPNNSMPVGPNNTKLCKLQKMSQLLLAIRFLFMEVRHCIFLVFLLVCVCVSVSRCGKCISGGRITSPVLLLLSSRDTACGQVQNAQRCYNNLSPFLSVAVSFLFCCALPPFFLLLSSSPLSVLSYAVLLSSSSSSSSSFPGVNGAVCRSCRC